MAFGQADRLGPHGAEVSFLGAVYRKIQGLLVGAVYGDARYMEDSRKLGPDDPGSNSLRVPTHLDWHGSRRALLEEKYLESSASGIADSLGRNSERDRNHL